jgi:hypothetical protein
MSPAAVIGLLASCLVGCIEVDGDHTSTGAQTQLTSCGKPHMKRKSVAKEMLSALKACCDGRGRLVPSRFVPGDFRDWLKKGPNGTVCLPEEIATDALWSPRQCVSVLGLEGACISTCIPMVTEQAIELPQDVCSPTQRCAPCIHPQTMKPTGACDIGERACTPYRPVGKCDELPPTMDLNDFALCCGGDGHCATKDLVAGSVGGLDLDQMLSRCPDGSYCVPKDILARAGRYQPPTCRSVGNREGRCLSLCVELVAKEKDYLPQASCKTGERCAPCFDPRAGKPTGACSFGPCDKPAEAARPFEPCGVGKDDALCVPDQLVPAKERCNFDNKGCGKGCNEAGTICVPKKVVDGGVEWQPKSCKASVPGLLAWFSTLLSDPAQAAQAATDYSDGRCLSRCLPDVKKQIASPLLEMALKSTECDADEVCVPCYDPTKLGEGKVKTGACQRDPCPGS